MLKQLFFISLLASPAWSQALPHSETESFDYGWKFARFGSMPDGSFTPEPGANSGPLFASSSEGSNTAALAMDQDKSTRWCAASAADGQWLAIDFGQPVPVSKAHILWEKEANHLYKIEGSADGKKWLPLIDKTQGENLSSEDTATLKGRPRFLKITVKGTGGSNWASIRELSFTNSQGKTLLPLPSKENASTRPEAPGFSDKNWRSINLPHDWGVEGPFRMDLPNETGKLPWAGIGWYRKSFSVPTDAKDQRYYLDFDGVMSRPEVYVNGKLAGKWGYGYNSFRIDISPLLKAGEQNTVAVRVNNPENSSRWYPGGGIYRHVWLTKTNPIHIAHWGIGVSTPKITPEEATLEVKTKIDNTSSKEANLTVEYRLKGSDTLLGEGKLSVSSGNDNTNVALLKLPKPILWETTKPHLYTLVTTVLEGGKVVDKQETTFGVRTAEWKKDGFYLNGKRIQLQGVCQHHDLGPLGGASHEKGYERQIKILKEMGVNAIRGSHNPTSPEVLDLCDKHGILFIDELFDTWSSAKKGNDYSQLFKEWHEKDAMALIHRDKNHPSVIAWSLGNEIGDQGNAKGIEDAKKLITIFKREDPTRQTTIGCDNPYAWKNGFGELFDAYGFNYKPHLYKEFAQTYPERPYYGSETSSCVSTRGEYFFPVEWEKNKGFFNFQVSSYDLYAPGWAYRPDVEFKGQTENPGSAGEFVWTGFDYLGEPTPYNQDQSVASNFHNEEERAKAMEQLKKWGNKAPSRSSYFGIVDLCGFPKDRFYLYQSQWRPELPMAHILPHWNWPERVGQVTPVHVYSAGDKAELFLNGKSQGTREKGSDEQNGFRFVWNDVKYEPGTLKVVVTKGGKPWAESTKSTTGAVSQLKITPEKTTLLGDGRDLAYVTLSVHDSKGALVPTAKQPVKLAISGPGEIVGVCNGNPVDHSSFQKPEVSIFNGLAQVIIRTKRGESGTIKLLAKSPKVKDVGVTLEVTPATEKDLKLNR